MDSMETLKKIRQSFWLDNIRRDFLDPDRFGKYLRKSGITGLTSNPTIFENAIVKTDFYDKSIKKLSKFDISAEEIFENLMMEDIQKAADNLCAIHLETDGEDGYASIEISPKLARSCERTVKEAKNLFHRLRRKNVMIKVPATEEGIRAVKFLIADGVNVNATLVFSIERYKKLMKAYADGIKLRLEKGLPPGSVFSVASFFVSRIDTAVDRELMKIVRKGGERAGKAESLLGKTAVSNCLMAYKAYLAFFSSPQWRKLSERGARPQKLLWASTSVKNPDYPDTLYAGELALENTVNTLPESAIEAFRDHGKINSEPLAERFREAERNLRNLRSLGINLDKILLGLENEGIRRFVESYNGVVKHILIKSHSLAEERKFSFSGANINRIDFSDELEKMDFAKRLWDKDPALWKSDGDHARIISNSLGWLSSPYQMLEKADEIEKFARGVRKFKHAVLLGMGGSSLAPMMFASIFQKKEMPRLSVLDTTDPREIKKLAAKTDIAKTLFIYSSKSGGTIEPKSQFEYFFGALRKKGVKDPGKHFIAITDEGTPLHKMAAEKGFRKVFLNPPDIGGRFSALSYFGLVPAAICGADIRLLLRRAADAADLSKNENIGLNPGALLGALMGGAYLKGLDKLTLSVPNKISLFSLWVEQLVAESTGKENKGIVPVCGERISGKFNYQSDRFFVSLMLENHTLPAAREIRALSRKGHPVLLMKMKDEYDIGSEIFKWEVATAAAGALMRINPFDQPDVQRAKTMATALLDEIKAKGNVKLPERDFENENAAAALSSAMKKFFPHMSGNIFGSLFPAIGGKEYLAIMAYLPSGDRETEKLLSSFRESLKEIFHSATLFGYGPRYLHSSGQLHKGGKDNAIFLIITSLPDRKEDLEIPGLGYTFGQLQTAQAIGDFNALSEKNRRVIWIDLKKPFKKNIKYIHTVLRDRSIRTSGGGKNMKLAVRKRKTKKTAQSSARTAPRKRTTGEEYVVVDYPKNLETVTSRHYTFRIGTSECRKVEISINGNSWQPCRRSVGYWWYDWDNYGPGNYTAVARMTTNDGKYLISKKRRFRVYW